MKRAISFAVILIAVSFKINAQEVVQNNVKPINNSLEVVSKLRPVSFDYDKVWAEKLKLPTKTQFGFVGADVKNVSPEILTIQAKDYAGGKNSFKSAIITKVDYDLLIPLLVGSIKEQQVQIESLKKDIQLLKTQNAK
jgi:hypothetical protein